MELVWFAVGLLIGALVTYTWLHPGWLRARLLRRWLRKRLESYEKEDRRSEPSQCPHHEIETHPGGKTGTCLACRTTLGLYHDPQPTSPPPSALSTGRGGGPSEPSNVSPASTPWPEGWRENED